MGLGLGLGLGVLPDPKPKHACLRERIRPVACDGLALVEDPVRDCDGWGWG